DPKQQDRAVRGQGDGRTDASAKDKKPEHCSDRAEKSRKDNSPACPAQERMKSPVMAPIPSCPGMRSAVQCSTLGTLSLSIGRGMETISFAKLSGQNMR